MIRRLLIPILVLAALGIAAVPAFAADTQSDTPSGRRGGCLERADDRLARRAELASGLAEQLGVEADEVSAAFTAVLAERLQEAVSNDRLTMSQAETALERYESGTLVCSRALRARWRW